jgi:type II secretory pathway component PulM
MSKITIAILIFLLVGAYSIIRQNDLDVKENQEDRVSFVKKFSGWVLNLGKNVKDLTGEATKQEWLPQENQDNDTIK